MLRVAMGACSNCGVTVHPGDRFCNACGAPIAGAGVAATPAAPPPYAYARVPAASASASTAYGGPQPVQPSRSPQPPQPPQQPAAYVPAPQVHSGARCQLGHEIVPGTSYCPLGHPIALDQMQFANDVYGASFASPTYAAPAPVPAPAAPAYAPRPVQQDPQPQPYRVPAQAQGAPPYAMSHAPYIQEPPVLSQPAPSPAYERARELPGVPSPRRSEPSRDPVPPKVLRGFLVAYGRNPNGDFWPLTGGRHTIGRLGSSEGIEIPIQDPTVSSRHAALVVDPASGSIIVEDTGSTNGTFVNDEPIGRSGWRELRDGDRLRVGGFTTVVKVIGPI
jgi:hypothetical protein